MICEHCHREAVNSARICPVCGHPLRPFAGPGGAAAMRQGRGEKPPRYGGMPYDTVPEQQTYAQSGASRQDRGYSSGAGRPQNRRGVNREDRHRAPQRDRRAQARPRGRKVSRVNRALLLLPLSWLTPRPRL